MDSLSQYLQHQRSGCQEVRLICALGEPWAASVAWGFLVAMIQERRNTAVPFGYNSGFDVATLETLTSTGVTSAQKTAGADLTFQVTVSSIGTNVVIRLEGSLDDVSYFNLDSTNADTTITSDGTYGFSLSGCPVQYARLRLVSVSGGTPSVATSLGAM